ncbi:hypothetical protein ILUMI_20369 [Ignelater luminosus]|uniref:Uncharacterized protein n=1 Tax=Ignelater luminosus TaxID=2038154 RepID=A0A8K0CHI3_IGNLU|nr:hypothetical protein ILUMI_20369 [Ignelater luminosus]
MSLLTPEPTSLARAAGFNKVVVHKFFDTYETIVAETKLTPNRIFNADETKYNVVQKPQKILAQKGKYQIGAITSSKRGQDVSLDVFFKPLKTYFSAAITSKMFETLGEIAFPRAATMQTTINGFLKTDSPLVSGDSSIDEEVPPKQLSEIVTTLPLKYYPSNTGTSYI